MKKTIALFVYLLNLNMLYKFRGKLAQYLYKVSVTGSTETVEP